MQFAKLSVSAEPTLILWLGAEGFPFQFILWIVMEINVVSLGGLCVDTSLAFYYKYLLGFSHKPLFAETFKMYVWHSGSFICTFKDRYSGNCCACTWSTVFLLRRKIQIWMQLLYVHLDCLSEEEAATAPSSQTVWLRHGCSVYHWACTWTIIHVRKLARLQSKTESGIMWALQMGCLKCFQNWNQIALLFMVRRHQGYTGIIMSYFVPKLFQTWIFSQHVKILCLQLIMFQIHISPCLNNPQGPEKILKTFL